MRWIPKHSLHLLLARPLPQILLNIPVKSIEKFANHGQQQATRPHWASSYCFAQRTHAALDILQFGQDVQSEAVGLPPGAVAAVHEVAESQHQPEHLQHRLARLQSLGACRAQRRQRVSVQESTFGIFNSLSKSLSKCDDILRSLLAFSKK